MSIFKETFADYVKKQLEQRENIIASGAGKKTNISGSVFTCILFSLLAIII